MNKRAIRTIWKRKGDECLLVTACMGCIFRRHDSDEVNQLLELLMRETKDERSPIRSMANDYNIQT